MKKCINLGTSRSASRAFLLLALLPTMVQIATSQATRQTASGRASETVGQRLAADLQWTQEQREQRFAHMDRLFPTNRVQRGAHLHSLPLGERIALQVEGRPLQALMHQDRLAGVLVLQDGRIRLEQYGLSANRTTRWMSFSMTKSVTSTLMGAALHDGFIHNLDDSVTAYLPQMQGSAYDGVTIRQLLTMTSGVRWVEDYTAPDSDNVRLYSTPAAPGTDTVVAYMRRLPRQSAPGTHWLYNTGETDLTGALLRAATGRSLSAYLTQTVWNRYGMAADATWIAEDGRDYGGSGISATLQDWGRFGEFVRQGREQDREGTLPNAPVDAAYLNEATRTQQPTGEPGRGYGYQWWTYADGSFAALGIFGQSLLIDPARKLVVVTLGAWPQPSSPALIADRDALWSAIRSALDAEAAGRSAAAASRP